MGLLSDQKLVHYLVENAEWSIMWDGLYIARGVSSLGVPCRLGTSWRLLKGQVIHFGSIHGFLNAPRSVLSSNRTIVTFYHGRRGLEPGLSAVVDGFLARQELIWKVVVSCDMMRVRLMEWGVPEIKIVKIPLGVELRHFQPTPFEERQATRQRLGIPREAIVLGSFQKDGAGWGSGDEPKLVKGPDTFVAVAERLALNHPIHCVLTGPARGYVKNELSKRGIPFTHAFLKDYHDIVDYYRALDLYLVTSREEGGPKAVLEALATGTPLVTTSVGMAPDLIRHRINGMLCSPEDVEELAAAADEVLRDAALRTRIISSGLETVAGFDWARVAGLAANLYREALQ